MTNKIVKYAIAIAAIFLLAGCIAMALYIKNYNGAVNAVNVDSNTSYYSERITANADFGGRRLMSKTIVRKYDKHGRLKGEGKSLGELLSGRKVVLFLTRNNCNSCAENEVLAFNTMRKSTGLACDIIVVFNYPVHTDMNMAAKCDNAGFYEVDGGDLGSGIGDDSEYPFLFSSDDCRIVSAYCAENVLEPYIHYFHEYLVRFLSGDAA